jgi:hypothetical protein
MDLDSLLFTLIALFCQPLAKVLLKDENFKVRVFKFYSPQNQKSKISLVAHNREVTEIPIHTYIPEFSDEFYEQNTGENQNENFIIKVYIFGDYLLMLRSKV